MAWPTVCRAAPLVLILDHKLAKTTGSRRVALYAERSKLKLHLRTKAAERRFEKTSPAVDPSAKTGLSVIDRDCRGIAVSLKNGAWRV